MAIKPSFLAFAEEKRALFHGGECLLMLIVIFPENKMGLSRKLPGCLRGWTQDPLADKIGIDSSYLSK